MKMLVILAMAACLWVGALWAVTGAEPQGIANASAAGGQAAGSALATIDYQQHVHTILAAKCLSCHSAERRSGGLSLAAYADALEGGRSGAAVRPGDSAGSLLVERNTSEGAPPDPVRRAARSARGSAAIRRLIDRGAPGKSDSAAAKPK